MAKQKVTVELIQELASIVTEPTVSIKMSEYKAIEKKLDSLTRFVIDKGLVDEYNEFVAPKQDDEQQDSEVAGE